MQELIDYLITQDTRALIDDFAEKVLACQNTDELLQYIERKYLITCLLTVDDAKLDVTPTSRNKLYQSAYKLASDRFAELADGSLEL